MKKLHLSKVTLVALAFIAFTFSSCSTPHHSHSLTHIVLLWLNDPSDELAKKQVIETSRSLGNIPEVESIEIRTALPSNRSVVDSSYDLALVMNFASKQDLESYIVHPQHVKAVNEILKPRVKRFLVYDFLPEHVH